MKLIDALGLLKRALPENSPLFRVLLACGFTPLHVKTFLAAHLGECFPCYRIEIETGVFGDLAGTLERLVTGNLNAVAVLIEWSDLDPRLGIRSLGGWHQANLSDIVDSSSRMARRIEDALIRISHAAPVICSLPALPLPALFPSRPEQSSRSELQLHRLLASLAVSLSEQPGVRLLSAQALDEQSPPSERFDIKSELLSGFPYTLAHASTIAELLAAGIHNPPPKKGLITDLDDTFWSGILGEVGVEGISWSLDQQTQMYGLYQQFLASLASTGTLIGIASKNDPALVKQAFERSDLLLSEDEIFPMEIHWDRKSESVGRILKAWNIGPESVVFVDDSAMEAAEVQSAFPEMLCMTFPSTDVRGIWNLLRELRRLFGKNSVSEEDSIRLRSIRAAHSLNESIRAPQGSADEFLADAKASIAFSIGRQPGDGRALELINKTNQFNLNGKRFTEAAYEQYLSHPGSFLITAAYRDKYGPLGRIAVLMGTSEASRVNLDVWVMSCRAFSRRIEHQCLKYLFDKFGAEEIVLDCQATPRNAPLQDFLTGVSGAAFAQHLKIHRGTFYETIPPLFHQIEETVNA